LTKYRENNLLRGAEIVPLFFVIIFLKSQAKTILMPLIRMEDFMEEMVYFVTLDNISKKEYCLFQGIFHV
jgi:hypothetical protein